MRAGISRRGNGYVSMGPVGWLILGPIIGMCWLMIMMIKLMVLVAVGICRAMYQAYEQNRRMRQAKG